MSLLRLPASRCGTCTGRLSLIRGLSRASGVQGALARLRDLAVTPDQTNAYAQAVKIYNPAFSYEHPAFVAFPNHVEDVKRCLRVANETETPVVIKSGGHSFAGYSTTDSNGFVISMRRLNSVTVKEARVITQSGASWGDVYSAVDDTGYVAVGGCVPAVGIGGYIQGGGYSLLSRGYGGLACDLVEAFTMVTADGNAVVRASKDENPDLFWALRGGGGGNFGALIDVELRLAPKPKCFVWSRLNYDTAEDTEKALIAIGNNLQSFPKELNLDIALHGFSGRKLLTLDAVYADHHEENVREALNSLHPTTTSAPQTYSSFLKFVTEYSKRHGFVHYEVEPVYVKGAMISTLPNRLAKIFAELEIPPECLIELVHMGGDIMALRPDETVFRARSAQYSFYTYGRYADKDDKSKRDEVVSFATTTYNAVRLSGCTVGSYVNYTDRYLKDWTTEYYGENYPRLCQVKEKWNPVGRGTLHFEQEIGLYN